MLSAFLAWILTGPINEPVTIDVAMAHTWLESRGEVEPVSVTDGGFWCGHHQSGAQTLDECRALMNPIASAVAFRREYSTWLDFTHGNHDRAWRGMGCGVKASRSGGYCRNYENRIEKTAAWIRSGEWVR